LGFAWGYLGLAPETEETRAEDKEPGGAVKEEFEWEKETVEGVLGIKG
jgi:hypothetical protein